MYTVVAAVREYGKKSISFANDGDFQLFNNRPAAVAAARELYETLLGEYDLDDIADDSRCGDIAGGFFRDGAAGLYRYNPETSEIEQQALISVQPIIAGAAISSRNA